MDTAESDDLADRVLASVLAAARQAFRTDVDPTLDPIEAGFDSIAAMGMAGTLEQELGVECAIEDVFDTTSLAELADLLVQRIDAAGSR
ncbi:acyl carrier protein [Saccharothrix variisporea]|uniref:Phosphopantetheine binding protein n=1 Tax=Saccharothrix variisporea TaxID=543527 RepID=A0A495X4K8_9PSEU|nr:acyl carrier protein [Saccharothrix variisporea]RKT69221.1 phosphopantetheine binding protein [Saccharothrix variisporea]